MEQMKFKQRCSVHPDSKIEYIKMDHSGQSASKPFFCCLDCIDSDPSLNRLDYLRIKEIFNSDIDKLINKWLPTTSKEIMAKLIDIVKENQSTDGVITKVDQYFKEFKIQVNESIDQIHKKMIQNAEELVYNNKVILQKYEQSSKIAEIKSYLLDNNINIDEKEKLCSELIKQSKQTINSNSLLSVINNNILFDLKPAQVIQKQIINIINNIELFSKNISFQGQKIDVKLMKTNWGNGQNCQRISNNDLNQSQVEIIQQNGTQNTVSNIILNPDYKYIFRFKINHLLYTGYFIYFGIMQDKNIHINNGYRDYLCCSLENSNSKVFKSTKKKGISKDVLGNTQFELSEEKEIELRVCIKEKILEVLDYPHYKHKMVLEDEHIPKLINAKDLRLYIGLYQIKDKVTLTESLIVNQFP